MKQKQVNITHPDIPGSKGQCLAQALQVWLDHGWVVVEPPAPPPPEPTFTEVNGEMVPTVAPEWTPSGTSDQEADAADDHEEKQS